MDSHQFGNDNIEVGLTKLQSKNKKFQISRLWHIQFNLIRKSRLLNPKIKLIKATKVQSFFE